LIRQATADDAPGILEIYAPFCQDSIVSFELQPPTVEEMQARIEKCNSTHLWIVDADEDGINAYAYASPHKERAAYRWSVDVSIYISENKRKQGLGTKLYTHLFDILRERGFYNAYAGVTLPNDGSVRLHEKLGFQQVGVYKNVGYKLGKWHDVGWWHLQLLPLADQPREPVFTNAPR
jgi:L-amino acid N-acyltransferase YncA